MRRGGRGPPLYAQADAATEIVDVSEHPPRIGWTRDHRAIVVRTISFVGVIALSLLPMSSSLPYESMVEQSIPIRERDITHEDFDDGSWAEQRETGEIVFNGSINRATALGLMRMIRTRPAPTKLVITSEGGTILWADRLGQMVRRASIPVYVEDYCMSACVDVLVHAPRAVIWLGAVIALHRASKNGDLVDDETLENVLARDQALFRSLGVDPSPLAFLRTYETWLLSIGDLAQGGYVDQVIDPSTGHEVDAKEFCEREPETCDPQLLDFLEAP